MTDWDTELSELVAHRGSALVGYAYLLSGDRRESEDVVQEALVKVFARLRGPGGRGAGRPGTGRGGSAGGSHRGGSVVFSADDGVTNLEGYVRRAILTGYLDGYRRRRRWLGLRHLVADDEPARSPEGAATARADVAAGLARLSPRQRACVVLRYFEDLTVPQIADVLGIAQGTIKRHLSDAMRTLHEVLADDLADDTAPVASRAQETTESRRARR